MRETITISNARLGALVNRHPISGDSNTFFYFLLFSSKKRHKKYILHPTPTNMHNAKPGDVVAYEITDRKGKWRWTLGIVTKHPHHETYRLTEVENWKRKPRELTPEEKAKSEAIRGKIRNAHSDANERRRQAFLTAQEIRDKAGEIAAQRKEVDAKMADAQQQLSVAREAVLKIEEVHMREIRSYKTPPATVRLVLDAVLSTMTNNKYDGKKSTWEAVLKQIREKNFQETVAAFDATDLSIPATKTLMGYLQDASFTHEAAMNASKATGPLYLWVAAQGVTVDANSAIRKFKLRVRDLEEQLVDLNAQAESNAAELKAILETIANLEQTHDDLMTDDLTVLRGMMSLGGLGGLGESSMMGSGGGMFMSAASFSVMPDGSFALGDGSIAPNNWNVFIENKKDEPTLSILSVTVFDNVTNEVTHGEEAEAEGGDGTLTRTNSLAAHLPPSSSSTLDKKAKAAAAASAPAMRKTMTIPFQTLMRLQCQFDERIEAMATQTDLEAAHAEAERLRGVVRGKNTDTEALQRAANEAADALRGAEAALETEKEEKRALEAASAASKKRIGGSKGRSYFSPSRPRSAPKILCCSRRRDGGPRGGVGGG